MKIRADGKIIKDTLEDLRSFLGSFSDINTITLTIERENEVVMSASKKDGDRVMSLVVPNFEIQEGLSSGEKGFTVYAESFYTALRKTGKFTLTTSKKGDSSSLKITSSSGKAKIQAELNCVNFIKETVSQPGKDALVVRMTEERIAALKELLRHLNISPMSPDVDSMYINFNVSKTRTRALVADNWHMAYCVSKGFKLDSDAEFAVEAPTLNTILNSATSPEYTLWIGKSRLHCKGEGFRLEMPFLQDSTSVPSFTLIKDIFERFKEEKPKSFTVNKTEFSENMNSLKSVADLFGVTVDSHQGWLRLRLGSQFGNMVIQDKVKMTGWKDESFVFDLNIMGDILSSFSGKEVKMQFTDSMIMMEYRGKSIQSTYLLATIGEEE